MALVRVKRKQISGECFFAVRLALKLSPECGVLTIITYYTA